jgi:predicted ABC-type ATPase
MPSPVVHVVETPGVYPIVTPAIDDLHPEVAKAVRHLSAAAPAQKHPFFINITGVPGAGKSTFLPALTQVLADRAPQIIAFDRMMNLIPEYHAEPDREAAFRNFEVPAREGGYALIRALIEKRANAIFEHSSALVAHTHLLSFAREQGYYTCIVQLRAPLDAAKHRVDERQQRVGRHTPHSFVDERARAFAELLPRYQQIVHRYMEFVNEDRDESGRAAYMAERAAEVAATLPE